MAKKGVFKKRKMYSKNDRVFAKFYRCFQKTKGVCILYQNGSSLPNKKHGLDTIIKPFLYLDMRVEIPHLIVEGNKIYNMCESKPYDGAKPMYLVDDIDNRDILKVIIINTCNSLLIKKENKSKFIKGSD